MKWTILGFLLQCILLPSCHPSEHNIVKGRYVLNDFINSENEKEGIGIVEGYVRDAGDGDFLPGCSVFYIKDDEMVGTLTDEKGYFRIQVPIGKYKFHVRGARSPLDTKIIEVSDKRIIELIFFMGYTEIQ